MKCINVTTVTLKNFDSAIIIKIYQLDFLMSKSTHQNTFATFFIYRQRCNIACRSSSLILLSELPLANIGTPFFVYDASAFISPSCPERVATSVFVLKSQSLIVLPFPATAMCYLPSITYISDARMEPSCLANVR